MGGDGASQTTSNVVYEAAPGNLPGVYGSASSNTTSVSSISGLSVRRPTAASPNTLHWDHASSGQMNLNAQGVKYS